jgi:hypothetical protein
MVIMNRSRQYTSQERTRIAYATSSANLQGVDNDVGLAPYALEKNFQDKPLERVLREHVIFSERARIKPEDPRDNYKSRALNVTAAGLLGASVGMLGAYFLLTRK